jgi:predicted nucleic acid-binding protein
MTLDHIPANAVVFLDANILVYYFTPDPTYGPACKLLMHRLCNLQDFSACTTTHVLSEVAHQLMILEAAQVFGWPMKGITHRLRKNPADVQKLTAFRRAIDEVPRLGIDVLPVERHLSPLAASLSQLHGLLTNDALILASMQDEAIRHLASGDSDFDRVPGITRYAPA